MKRSLGTIGGVLAILASLLTVVLFAGTPSASAHPVCEAAPIYKFKDKVTLFHPTNVASDWVYLPHGGSITYTKTKTATVSASVTATVSAEAGVIFAKASTSIGVTVGGSWSKTDSWAYNATVPKGTGYRYRLHMYHFSVNFKVMKKVQRYNATTCYWVNAWSNWQTVRHAPAKSSRNIWRLDKVSV